MSQHPSDRRVPVTLITGFLGAGKTTLLNRLLTDPSAGRVAVIMNEFGEIGLDHDLIEQVTEETILLQSGCLCCALLGDLSKTLASLVTRRAAGKLDFDRVVIETSGLADPGPILHTLMVTQLVAFAYRLDGVVTLVDAVSGMTTLDTQPEAMQQVAMADRILLTKTDLGPADTVARLESRLAQLNHAVHIQRATQGQIAPGSLFGLSAMRKDVTETEIGPWLGLATPDPLAGPSGAALSGMAPKPASTLPLGHSGAFARHGGDIASAAIEIDHPIPAQVFDFWLDGLIAAKGDDILRVKGIVHLEGVDCPFVFHGVQRVFDQPVPLKSRAGADKTGRAFSRVVVIARNMKQAELQASLQTLLIQTADLPDETDGGMVQVTEIPL